MYGIDFGLFMHIDIRQTGRDLVEKCVLCGTANGSSGIMKSGGSFAKLISFFT